MRILYKVLKLFVILMIFSLSFFSVKWELILPKTEKLVLQLQHDQIQNLQFYQTLIC